MQTCLQLGRLLVHGCAARHTYISKYHMTRHRLRSAEALQYMRQAKRSRIYDTKKPSQCKQVCRKAHLYLKISHDKTPSALPRRYSICGKRSEAEYTKKPLQCKRVCRKHTYISKYHMTRHRLRSAEALQYMRQAKRSRIYELLSPSSSMPCILLILTHLNGAASKHSF